MTKSKGNAVEKARSGILHALSFFRSVNRTEPSLHEVCVEAGYAGIDNKAFRQAVKELQTEGIVNKKKGAVKGGDIEATPKGTELLPKPRGQSTNDETQAKYLDKILSKSKGLPPEEKTRTVFEKLMDGKSHTKKSLVALIGYAGTDNRAFRNLMNRMIALKVIEQGPEVQASNLVFPRGRPGKQGITTDHHVASPSKKRKTLDKSSPGAKKSRGDE